MRYRSYSRLAALSFLAQLSSVIYKPTGIKRWIMHRQISSCLFHFILSRCLVSEMAVYTSVRSYVFGRYHIKHNISIQIQLHDVFRTGEGDICRDKRNCLSYIRNDIHFHNRSGGWLFSQQEKTIKAFLSRQQS